MRFVARVPANLAFSILLLSAGSVTAQEYDRFIGTWILNVAKSEYPDTGGTESYARPARPRSEIRTFDYTRDGLVLCTLQTESASGNRNFYHWYTTLDGKHIPEFTRGRRRESSSSIAVKLIDASTIQIEGKRLESGRVTFTATATVSPDGNTLTWRTKRIDEQGKEVPMARVYEKQPSGRSSD